MENECIFCILHILAGIIRFDIPTRLHWISMICSLLSFIFLEYISLLSFFPSCPYLLSGCSLSGMTTNKYDRGCHVLAGQRINYLLCLVWYILSVMISLMSTKQYWTILFKLKLLWVWDNVADSLSFLSALGIFKL